MHFERRADQYSGLADIQRDCAAELVADFEPTGLGLDVGAGTGFIARARALPGLIQVDLSGAMLAHAAGQRVVCDARRLPFADQTFDYAVSNMALQWICDPSDLIRVLRPGGVLRACVVLSGSVPELAAAREAAGLAPVASLPDLAFWQAQFGGARMRQQTRQLDFASASDALRSVRGVGAVAAGEQSVTPSQYRALLAQLGCQLSYHLLWIEWRK